MADENTERRRTLILQKKLTANGTRRRLTTEQYVLQYVQVALGREWPSFFFFLSGKTFTHAQYINIMHALC